MAGAVRCGVHSQEEVERDQIHDYRDKERDAPRDELRPIVVRGRVSLLADYDTRHPWKIMTRITHRPPARTTASGMVCTPPSPVVWTKVVTAACQKLS